MKKSFFGLTLAIFCLAYSVVAQQTDDLLSDSFPTAVRAYTLGPGDDITLRVIGDEQYNATVTVDENGNIELPYFDKPIPAMCKTERELRADMVKLLKKYLKAPQIGLSATARRSRPPVSVSGEVRTQQQVVLTRKTRLWELVTFSGGITEDAGGMIQVFRTQPPICAEPEEVTAWKTEAEANKEMGVPSRLFSISTVQQGKDESNPIIYPGDIIIVQRAKPVYIVGEVHNGGGGLSLKEGGLPLSRAIAMVGGVNPQAKSKDVKIYRAKPDSMEKEIITANLDLIKTNKEKDIMLEPYDIVEVNKASDSIGKILLKTVTGAGTSGIGSIVTNGAIRVLY